MNDMAMRRREVLAGEATAAAATGLPRFALAQGGQRGRSG
jgi:hypothetical protein